jgi:cytochrome c553
MKIRFLVVPLLAILFILQATTLPAVEGQGMDNMPGMPGMSGMPGMEAPAPAAPGAKTDPATHDHSKHKVKEPVLMPTKESMLDIGGMLGDIERGRKLYNGNCVFCHGRKGLGDGPIVIGLDASPPAYFREDGILYMTDRKGPGRAHPRRDEGRRAL